MNFSVHVEVSSLEGMADPEGRTIERALQALGFAGVHEVHVGKVMRFFVEADDEATARDRVEEMCAKLLANPVIEHAEISLSQSGSRA